MAEAALLKAGKETLDEYRKHGYLMSSVPAKFKTVCALKGLLRALGYKGSVTKPDPGSTLKPTLVSLASPQLLLAQKEAGAAAPADANAAPAAANAANAPATTSTDGEEEDGMLEEEEERTYDNDEFESADVEEDIEEEDDGMEEDGMAADGMAEDEIEEHIEEAEAGGDGAAALDTAMELEGGDGAPASS